MGSEPTTSRTTTERARYQSRKSTTFEQFRAAVHGEHAVGQLIDRPVTVQGSIVNVVLRLDAAVSSPRSG